jgi:hypothetical protein
MAGVSTPRYQQCNDTDNCKRATNHNRQHQYTVNSVVIVVYGAHIATRTSHVAKKPMRICAYCLMLGKCSAHCQVPAQNSKLLAGGLNIIKRLYGREELCDDIHRSRREIDRRWETNAQLISLGGK